MLLTLWDLNGQGLIFKDWLWEDNLNSFQIHKGECLLEVILRCVLGVDEAKTSIELFSFSLHSGHVLEVLVTSKELLLILSTCVVFGIVKHGLGQELNSILILNWGEGNSLVGVEIDVEVSVGCIVLGNIVPSGIDGNDVLAWGQVGVLIDIRSLLSFSFDRADKGTVFLHKNKGESGWIERCWIIRTISVVLDGWSLLVNRDGEGVLYFTSGIWSCVNSLCELK